MRTEQEILDRIDAVKAIDWLGTERADLMATLPFESFCHHLKNNGEGFNREGEYIEPRDEESVKQRMLDYMPFAWDKANNRRGI